MIKKIIEIDPALGFINPKKKVIQRTLKGVRNYMPLRLEGFSADEME